MASRTSSPSILFDAPGPRTRARHRTYTLVALVGILAVVGFALSRLYAEGQFAYDQWEVFITPRFVEVILVDGVLVTLQMASLAVLFSVAYGVVFGVAKLSSIRAVSVPATVVVEFFRAVPVLLLMVFFFSLFGIRSETAGPFWSVVLALTLYNGSVLAEVFRAGILAVPHGQSEAGLALGLRRPQVTNLILLPQAVRIMLPAIISQCVVALKDTSLGYAVAAPGLTRIIQQIYQQFGNQTATIFVTAALYIVMCVALTVLATWVQRRYLGERTPLEVAHVGAAPTDQQSGISRSST